MARPINRYSRAPATATFALFLLLFAGLSLAKDKDSVVIFRPAAEQFTEVVKGIEGELGEDLNFSEVMLQDNADATLIATSMKSVNPKAVVLIDNRAIKLYSSYQKQNPEAPTPPCIALAALFIDRFIGDIKNATGIRYEIPAVTSIVGMRALLATPVKKVGVIYRTWMAGMIIENSRYAKAEGVELVAAELPDKSDDMVGKIKEALKSLLDRKVDAIWILSDNELLNGATVGGAWQPGLEEAKVPVIVGVKSLVASKMKLGSFAVVPDHFALGVQAASILSELMDSEWDMGSRKVEQPLSVKKIINIKIMDGKGIQYQKEKLGQVDEVMNQ